MRIQYQKGDPRAGRVVDIHEDTAKRFIEAGAAKQVGEDVVTVDAADMPDEDGSYGDGRRAGVNSNSSAKETTTDPRRMKLAEDEAEESRKASKAAAEEQEKRNADARGRKSSRGAGENKSLEDSENDKSTGAGGRSTNAVGGGNKAVMPAAKTTGGKK